MISSKEEKNNQYRNRERELDKYAAIIMRIGRKFVKKSEKTDDFL